MALEVFVSSAEQTGLFGGLRQWSLLNAAEAGTRGCVVGLYVLKVVLRDGSPKSPAGCISLLSSSVSSCISLTLCKASCCVSCDRVSPVTELCALERQDTAPQLALQGAEG